MNENMLSTRFKKEDENKISRYLARLVTFPLTSAIFGFGMLWMYKIMGNTVWVSIFAGMLASALMSELLIFADLKINSMGKAGTRKRR